MNEKNNKNKKKGGGKSALIAFLILFVLPQLVRLLEDIDFEYGLWRLQRWMRHNGVDPQLLPLIFIGLVIVIIALLSSAKSARKRRAAETGRTYTNTNAGRTSAAKQRPDPRTRSFTPPEPECIVCDHTGEDHFLRDKAQRIAQLDEWLKNGLIDRAEYRVLRDRYERDL